jgi:hypothetical protein
VDSGAAGLPAAAVWQLLLQQRALGELILRFDALFGDAS